MKYRMNSFNEQDFLNGAIAALASRHTGSVRIYARSDEATCDGCIVCEDILPQMQNRLDHVKRIVS